jgi:hypothetical protein
MFSTALKFEKLCSLNATGYVNILLHHTSGFGKVPSSDEVK